MARSLSTTAALFWTKPRDRVRLDAHDVSRISAASELPPRGCSGAVWLGQPGRSKSSVMMRSLPKEAQEMN